METKLTEVQRRVFEVGIKPQIWVMSEKVCKAALFFLSETCSRGRGR